MNPNTTPRLRALMLARLRALRLAATVAALGNVALAVAAATPQRRSLKNIAGPATNWPSGKVHRKPRGNNGQQPKFVKERKRKQHVHPLRDEHGAYTLTGRNNFFHYEHNGRYMWLAGISAQRGY